MKEECGIFGVYSKKIEDDLAFPLCVGLSSLQHRGEESCGMAINSRGVITCHKNIGLVSDVFTDAVVRDLPKGKMGIGHVRYSTTGCSKKENAQPIFIQYKKGNLCIAHNGNLTNAAELREELESNGCIFTTTSDTEVIAYIIARERLKTHSIEDAVFNSMKYIKGAYSLLVMSSRKIIAARDPYGFRPLCMGTLEDQFIFSSESCALDIIGAKFERDIKPGEVVTICNDEITTKNFRTTEKDGLCIFEYVYFSRPDSIVDGYSVHEFRKEAGKYLSRQAPVDADFVAGVPDSGLDAALGYSEESQIPYGMAFVKSKYIGRTFIQATQNKRSKQVVLKLNPLKQNIKGKRIVLIDDSIVRGTTITRLVKILKREGVKEIHLRIAAPPFIGMCYFGTDVTSEDGLIAKYKSVEEIRQQIGVDSLEYLSLENLRKIAEKSNMKSFCEGCFTGEYPVEVPKELYKNKFDQVQF